MPNSRTSPSSGIYSLRHWALTFKLTQQQIKTTRFAHHWDKTIRCRYFCRHRLYSRLTTPHRRTPISGRVSRPDLAPVSFSSFPFLREGITLLQPRQDGAAGTFTLHHGCRRCICRLNVALCQVLPRVEKLSGLHSQ